MSDEGDGSSFKKRKKGRSFLQKAKKFGRQGQRGRGSEIEQDQYDYLVRVLERWRQGFDTEEEKVIFVENVMVEAEGNERQLCGNQLGSRVIEMLLPSAEESVLRKFSDCLSQDLRLVCLDPFMSHVLEKLLILQSFAKEAGENTLLVESRDWVVKVSKFVTNNVEDFCNDSYASHLLRTCCECLAGQRFRQERSSQTRTEGYDDREVWRMEADSEATRLCAEVLETFASRLCSLSPDLLCSELCVRVLSVFCNLAASKHHQLADTVISHLLASVLSQGIDTQDTISVRSVKVRVEQEPVFKRRELFVVTAT